MSPIPGIPCLRAFCPSRRKLTRNSRCRSNSFTFSRNIANPSGESARIPSAEGGDEILYGAFIQLNRFAISGDANAIPRRIPARPNALERVCMTMRFGYEGTAVHMDVLRGEKSTYASSRTNIPFQNDRVRERRLWTDEGEICAPVGFPG